MTRQQVTMPDTTPDTTPDTAPDPGWQVPVVDIGAYVEGQDAAARRATAAAMDAACRSCGFVQVRGHGIPVDAIAALGSAIDAFFALPEAAKLALRTPPDINRGYAPRRSERLSLSLGIEAPSVADYFEAFNIGAAASDFPGLDLPADVYAENVWPAGRADFDATAFRTALEVWFAQAGRVARTLCAVFADALAVDRQYFETVTSHSIDVLRLVHYAHRDDEPPLSPDATGMGAHTDYGIVTVLWADPVPGLQVLGSDGVWHDVIPEPGCLLVNLGDLTARWTGDRWRSTLHRVVPPVRDGRIARRRSAAFFHDGNIDARIETLPGCGDGTAYPPIVVAEHLAAKLAGSRGGQRNADGGEAAGRVRSAGH